ncbi:hypothetical protein [Rhizobium phaseoli]|uniref:hypothetical protein n=1 Tax=Rhizobium phaseoli TaxID=396 RepID=UPI002552E54E|nr:hypothetical protein [Rhizobium phaseoli]MDK4727431.1 hypothetical protein [Rhizobium phaseoli]
MSRSPWKDPPLTRTPLDYVPIDRPTQKITPTVFKAPVLRRAAIAAAAFGGAVAALFFIPVATIAIALMIGAVLGGEWAVKKLNARDERRDDKKTERRGPVDTLGCIPPDPFSWWPAIVAVCFIVAICFF